PDEMKRLERFEQSRASVGARGFVTTVPGKSELPPSRRPLVTPGFCASPCRTHQSAVSPAYPWLLSLRCCSPPSARVRGYGRGAVETVVLTGRGAVSGESESSGQRFSGCERNPEGYDRTPDDLTRTREFWGWGESNANCGKIAGKRKTPRGLIPRRFVLTG